MLLLTFLLISGRVISVYTGKENGIPGLDIEGRMPSSGSNGRGIAAVDSNGGSAVAATNPNRANVEVVLYESDFNGDYNTRTFQLVGDFSTSGAKISAEGDILQVYYNHRLYLGKFCSLFHVQ